MTRRLTAAGHSPRMLLAVLVLVSLGARVAWLGSPCRSPCRGRAAHILIFDESYYVNAARIIAGIRPPPGQTYADAPLGTDPNSEHPQLAKLVMAGAMDLFGDTPLAWRLGSLICGALAIIGMYALARVAGADAWVAVAAAALMAADNLLLVHGRTATLDVYALAAMVWGGVLYLRERPLAAGAALGVGACAKDVAVYLLLAFALLELGRLATAGSGSLPRWWRRAGGGAPVGRWMPAVVRLLPCAASTAVSFLALLALLDWLVRPWDPGAGKLIAAGGIPHLAHIVSFAHAAVSPQGPQGIASYPWWWLADQGWIVYLNINPASPGQGLAGYHPAAHFLGLISPAVLTLGLAGLVVAAAGLAPRLPRRLRPLAPPPRGVALVGLAWFAGTFLPFVALSVLWSRTSYIYYMIIVMPGLYLAGAELLGRWRRRRAVLAIVAALTLAAAVIPYPFTPLP